MNIHPIFVHFPIALLFFYSVGEILILFPFVKNKDKWRDLLFAVLFVGVVSSFFTLQTGEVAEHLIGAERGSDLRLLINRHALFASISVYIYSILLICQIIKKIYQKKDFISSKAISRVLELLNSISNIFLSNPLLIVLSILGLIALMITGALGGAITYGVDTDPIVSIVYKIFVK